MDKVAVEECELLYVIDHIDKLLVHDNVKQATTIISSFKDLVRKNIKFLKEFDDMAGYRTSTKPIDRAISKHTCAAIDPSFKMAIVSAFNDFYERKIDAYDLYKRIKKIVCELFNHMSLEVSMRSLSIAGISSSSSSSTAIQLSENGEKEAKVSLRPYQESLVRRCWYQFTCKQSSGPILIYLPTGGGKTVIACEIISRIASEKKRVGFFVHSCALFEQAHARICQWPTVPKKSVSIVKGGKALSVSEEDLVFICTIQAFEKMQKDEKKAPILQQMKLDYILIDECHRSYAESYQRMLQHFPNAKIAGFTATPFRADLHEELITTFTGGIIDGPSIADLIEQKCLVPTLVYRSSIANPLSYKIGSGCNPGTPSKMLSDEEFLVLAIKRWAKIKQSGYAVQNAHHNLSINTTIVFCKDISHSKTVVKLFEEIVEDVRVERLDKSTKEADRILMLERLKSYESQVLVCVDAVSEGFDLPQIDCIMMIRPCTSRVLYVQQIGRGLRPFGEKKKFCLILDEANNTLVHGHIELNRNCFHNIQSTDHGVSKSSSNRSDNKETAFKVKVDSNTKGISISKINGTTSLPCSTKGCPSLISRISHKTKRVLGEVKADDENAKKNENNNGYCIGCQFTVLQSTKE